MKNLLNDSPFVRLSGLRQETIRLAKDRHIKNKIVLDIGCGIGWSEWDYLQRGVRKVFGIDVSEENIKTAAKIGHKSAIFKLGNATDLPFESKVFDTVVSWEVLEHIPQGEEEVMFKEVYRVLKPGGYFLMSTPNKTFVSTILDPAWWFVAHRHYSKKQVIKFAKTVGFRVEKVYIKGGIWSVLYAINLYFSKWFLRKPPLLDNFFFTTSSKEYVKSSGFVSIFLKCRK